MYDYEGAIKAGANPDDVLNYLSSHNNYDASAALKAGANKMDVIKFLSTKSTVSAPAPAPATPQKSFGQKAMDFIKNPTSLNPISLVGKGLSALGNSGLFPGQKVGQAIGTLSGLATEKLNGLSGGQDNSKFYDTSAPTPLQVGGDIAQGALTVAAPNVGNGASVLGRITANMALGAGLAGANDVAEGKKATPGSLATGAAVAGAASAATEAASALLQNLPKWFAKSALPKLANKNLDYAVDNVPFGTTQTMLNNSFSSIKSYKNQVESILTHPEFINETGSPDIINTALSSFSNFENADLTPDKVVSILKQVAPGNKTLVDKLANGTATLLEKNTLRSELDLATAKAYGDKPTLTFAKKVGKGIADLLRDEIQTTAPETAPIFANFSKELGLNGALQALAKKKVFSPFDFVVAYEGYRYNGIQGAVEAIAAEKLLQSGGARLVAGKVVRNIGNVAIPAIRTITKAAVPPIIKTLPR